MGNEQEYIELFGQNREMIDSACASLLNSKRQEAFERFKAAGFPTPKEEKYRYTDVRPIFAENYGMNLGRVAAPINPKEYFSCDVPNLHTLQEYIVNDTYYNNTEKDGLPEGAILGSLNTIAAQHPEKVKELAAKLSSAQEVNFLDIELPDSRADKVKLSDVHKKITLVYFWTASDAAQKMFNLDVLAPVYEKYHDKGFEIYQVSLDVDNGLWARVMREQKLPWTNVSDISGGASRYVLAYNLTKIPSAFLIGGNGMSGAMITDAGSLSAAIEKALK